VTLTVENTRYGPEKPTRRAKVWSVVGRDVEMGFRKDKVKEAI